MRRDPVAGAAIHVAQLLGIVVGREEGDAFTHVTRPDDDGELSGALADIFDHVGIPI